MPITVTAYKEGRASWAVMSLMFRRIVVHNEESSARILTSISIPLARSQTSTKVWGSSGYTQCNTGTWTAVITNSSSQTISSATVTTPVSLVTQGTSISNQGYFNNPTTSTTFTMNQKIPAGGTVTYYLYAYGTSSATAIQHRNDVLALSSTSTSVQSVGTPTISISPTTVASVGEMISFTINKTVSSDTLKFQGVTGPGIGGRGVGRFTPLSWWNTSISPGTYNVVAPYYDNSNLYSNETGSAHGEVIEVSSSATSQTVYSASYEIRNQPRNMASNGFTWSATIDNKKVSTLSNTSISPNTTSFVVNWSAFAIGKHLGNFNWYRIYLRDCTDPSNTIVYGPWQGSNVPSASNSKTISIDGNSSKLEVGHSYQIELRCTYHYSNSGFTGSVEGTLQPLQSAIFTSNTFFVADNTSPQILAPYQGSGSSAKTNPLLLFRIMNDETTSLKITSKSGGNSQTTSYPNLLIKATDGLNKGSVILFKPPNTMSSDSMIFTIEITTTYGTIKSNATVNKKELPVIGSQDIKMTKDVPQEIYSYMSDIIKYYEGSSTNYLEPPSTGIINPQSFLTYINYTKTKFEYLTDYGYNTSMYNSMFDYNTLNKDTNAKIVAIEDVGLLSTTPGNLIGILYYIFHNII